MIEFTTRRRITLTVNGVRVTRDVDVADTLAEFLRDGLGLTGTKVSCGLQVCGVCSVLVDGEPVSACAYLAVDASGRGVDTVEGLEGGSELHPLQEAFLDHFAFQCGFCTSGFLMMACALLEDEPQPSPERVREYLDGNLCRCTGYRPILDAVLAAADSMDQGEGS